MYYLPKLLKRIKLSSKKNCVLDSKSKVLGGCTLLNVSMGKYSYIGENNTIVNCDIGSFCSIAGGCMIGGGEHPVTSVSTSPVFHHGKNCLGTNFADADFNPYKKTVIGNDVWIAGRVLIKGGVVIGDGAVIGMGSVVTKDVGPYEIWAGNPARLIRKRFEDDVIDKMLQIKWWEFDDEKLKKQGVVFDNPDSFLDCYE